LGYFFHRKSYVFIFTKLDWATFWATLSQTQLVTLHKLYTAARFTRRIFFTRNDFQINAHPVLEGSSGYAYVSISGEPNSVLALTANGAELRERFGQVSILRNYVPEFSGKRLVFKILTNFHAEAANNFFYENRGQ
jgi:hypothetical protein